MDENDAINKPFAGLPRFLEEHRIKVKTEEHPREIVKKNPVDDDENLLRKAMEGVRAMTPDEKKSRFRKKVPIAAHRQTEDGEKLLQSALADQNVINVTNLPEYMEGRVEGMNPLVLEKLRRGEFSVQGVIDLHGLSIDSARETFEFFLSDAVKKGLRCVKVIHGRGLRSKKDPTIRDRLKAWIVRAMHRKWVTAFSNAVMSDGGPGATYILLRNKPEKKRIHIIG